MTFKNKSIHPILMTVSTTFGSCLPRLQSYTERMPEILEFVVDCTQNAENKFWNFCTQSRCTPKLSSNRSAKYAD